MSSIYEALIQLSTPQEKKKIKDGGREKERDKIENNMFALNYNLIIINYYAKGLTNYLSSYLFSCILLIVNKWLILHTEGPGLCPYS